ncbi:MAG: lamin tail domain-containing protein [Verrucomicrobiales bacterium]|nr:lamin tail domain-containing protein [Verrucomicrobiales bacterium]
MNTRHNLALLTLLACLVPSTAFAASQLVLSEFMAGNSSTLPDEDGDFEDWIEIHNQTEAAVNLAGWGLTDNSGAPLKWAFPSTNLPAKSYLIVFASAKDRRAPGGTLHTNFKLSSDGEYLALVEPDGVTKATEYSPAFPRQFTDISFGPAAELSTQLLVSPRSPGRLHIPSSSTGGQSWTLPGFDDSSWASATNGIGFETPAPEYAAGAFPDRVLAGGPLLYLAFGESGTTLTGNQGSLGSRAAGVAINGAQLNLPGPRPPTYAGLESSNGAAGFDGIDDRIEVAYMPELNPQLFTVGCWVRLTETSTRVRSPLSSRADPSKQGYAFQAGANQRWSFLTGNGGQGAWTALNGPAVSLNSWTLLVGTFDGTSMRFYVNGATAGTIATTFTPNTSGPLRVGAGGTNDSAAEFFPGQVDEVFVLERALSAAEIIGFYRTGTNGVFLPNASYASLIATDIGNLMHGVEASAWLRLPFVVSNLSSIGLLRLRMKYDDGFVAYLNGQEITGAHAPPEVSWDSKASERHPNDQAIKFEEFNVTAARGFLQEGTNILAIHGLNLEASNRDFLMLAELEATYVGDFTTTPRYFRRPTPGQPNSQGSQDLGPILSEIAFSPAPPLRPSDSEDITVTARVTPAFSAVQEVNLRYRIMYGATNTLRMLDDGKHADGGAGDGLYGAVIPADASKPGQLVRFLVTATDAAGRNSRWPLFEDPENSPEYLGTVVANPGVTSALPVWEWFAQSTGNARNRTGSRGAVWFNGEYFDNIFVRERGGFTSIGSQKFDFNSGQHVRINEEVGRVEEANLNSNGGDPSYMRIPFSYELHRAAGSSAGNSFPILMRANNTADRVALYVEQVDERFLARRGYDRDGALYKFVQRAELTPGFNDVTDGVEKKTRLFEDRSDLQAISTAVRATNNIEGRAAFMFDNFNLPSFINYFAVRAVTRNIDAVRKNFYFYRDTNGTGEWEIFPWDMDLTWGTGGDFNHEVHPFHGDIAHRWLNPDQWNWVWEALFNDRRTRPLILRRLRSVMDEFLGPVGRLENRVDAWFAPAYPHLGNGVSNEVRALKSNIQSRRNELYRIYSSENTPAGINGVIPPPQPPNVQIEIASWEVNPTSGNQAEEYVCLTNPTPYAVDLSGWRLSGGVQFEFKPGTVVGSEQRLYVAADNLAFRRRSQSPKGGERNLVVGPYQGQLSARGEVVRLVDDLGAIRHEITTATNPSEAQRFLRITELMYHAPAETSGADASDTLDYLEFKNTSVDTTLSLRGIRLINGVRFDFSTSAVADLGAGQTVLVVKDRARFTSHYGPRPNIAGQYEGSLDNGGERLQLVDATGEEILDFAYQPDWHPLSDGLGFSLVIIDELAEPDSWGTRDQWQISASISGSPGLSNPTPSRPPGVWVNEVLSRTETPPWTDRIELRNPTSTQADIGGWWLSDDLKTPKKFRIPFNTRIAPGGYLVFSEADFGIGANGFALSADGDEVWLVSADATGELTGYLHGFRFGATYNTTSLGRHVTSTGVERLVPQTEISLGTENSGPRLGPLILSELYVQPPADNAQAPASDEFLEIQNSSTSSVLLFNPGTPTLPWRLSGGVSFEFPTNLLLAAGEHLIVVGFDPSNLRESDAFRAGLNVGATTRLLGPYLGRLDNAADTVILQAPDRLADGRLVRIDVDRVDYRSENPWPNTTRGTGLSLQRRGETSFGNDPTSWVGAAPSPGRALTTSGIEAPKFRLNPLSQTVVAGSDVRLEALATATPAAQYVWRHKGTPIPGATNQTLHLNSLQRAQAGNYDVIAYNEGGSAVSSESVISVELPPSILSQPQSLAVRPGSNVVLRVLAYSPQPITYQWRKNGTSLPGSTNSTLSLPNVQGADAAQYSVRVSDQVLTVTSDTALLSLLVDPLIIQQPLSQTVVAGSSITLSVSITNTATLPIGYRLRRNNVNVPTAFPGGFQVLSQHTAYFTVSGSNAAPPWSSYSIHVTNQARSTGLTSTNALLTYVADTDKDGLSDEWETRFFGSATGAPAGADTDGDRLTNLEEFIAGTNPTDALSYLRIEACSSLGGASVSFQARSNRTYSLHLNDRLAEGKWLKWQDIPAQATDRMVTIDDPGFSTNRFYRLTTPRQP